MCYFVESMGELVTEVNGEPLSLSLSLIARIFATNDFEFSTRKESAAFCLHALCIHRDATRKMSLQPQKRVYVCNAFTYVHVGTRRCVYVFSPSTQIFNIIATHLLVQRARIFPPCRRNHAPFTRNCKRFVQRGNRSKIIG